MASKVSEFRSQSIEELKKQLEDTHQELRRVKRKIARLETLIREKELEIKVG
jgi:ribosomal protein L29